jgi:hypothetical protein
MSVSLKLATASSLLSSALNGPTAGTGYGQLQVANSVTLNGALTVSLANGFVPVINDSFTVLTAGARSGTFANFLYPSNVVTMQLSNTANSVVVLVSSAGVPDKVLVPPQISGTNITLCWGALPNVTYQVEVNSTLDPATWVALPGQVTSSGDIACIADVLISTNRFYRVRVLP